MRPATILIGLLAFRLVLLPQGVQAEQAEQAQQVGQAERDFDLLYGNELKRVTATKGTEDDLALAAQLLQAAKAPKTDVGLIALLCQKAYELASRDPKGSTVAVQALELSASWVPANKVESLDRVVAIRQREFAHAKGDAKPQAAEALLGALDRAAGAKAEAGDLDGAAALYRRAMPLAGSGGPKERLQEKLDQLTARRHLAKQITDLKARIKAHPEDNASRTQLVRLYLVDLDKPAEAVQFLAEGVDEQMRKYVPAAAKALADVPALACLELGDWYLALADQAKSTAKGAMLTHAVAYYSRFLDIHPDEDASRTKASLALKNTEAALAKMEMSTSGKAGETKGWANVLNLVDLTKDCRGPSEGTPGKWEWCPNGLHVVARASDKIEMPIAPEGSYELRVRFTRNIAGGNVSFMLPVGGSSVAFVVDSNACRFCMIDDKELRCSSVGAGEVNSPYLLDCNVAVRQDQATIDVKLDGKPLANWQGQWARLCLNNYLRINPKALGVGGYFAQVTLHSVELRMTSGKATLLRPLIPPRPEPPPKKR